MEKKWQALHAIDDEYLEPLHVAEQADGSVIYEVGGEWGTTRDPEAAMRAAELRFRRLFPFHVCSRVCSSWALIRGFARPDRLGTIVLWLLAGSPALA